MPIPEIRDANAPNPFGRRRFELLYLLTRTGLALIIAFFVLQIKLDYIEGFLFDIRARFQPAQSPSGHVALIYVDDKTVQNLKSLPNAETLAQLLEQVFKYEPRHVVLDLRMDEIAGSKEQKQILAKIAAQYKNLSVATSEMVVKGEEGKLKLAAPLEKIHVAMAPRTADKNNFAKDNITRRIVLTFQDQRLLHLNLASTYNPDLLDSNKVKGKFTFIDSEQAYINFRKPGSFPSYSMIDVLNNVSDISELKDKIVIVGLNTGGDAKDYIFSPFNRDLMVMPTAEMHANMFDTLITNSSPKQAQFWLNFIFTALIAIITVNVVFALRPGKGLLVLLVTFASFCVIAFFAYWPFGYWVSMAHPLLTIFLCYYFFIPYRLIVENRRSWEIYQKHQLLQQVEELKTNFISMMSHDLKTPIARIQGMTDIISRDSTPLSTHQSEALDTIRHSSEDLLKFINSILQYGKIESQKIQLHMQSRDINALLEEVIKKHEFLGKLKHIQIISELETLFPIQVDPELMKQVFSNLIENAIKYSPENTKVLVTTEEKDGWIIIQVSDQGPGIPADELLNIFMKFFRSKTAKSSPIKGSGLGLYLAKYFTELHQGRIFAESTYGQGSTFTVELPIEGGRTHA